MCVNNNTLFIFRNGMDLSTQLPILNQRNNNVSVSSSSMFIQPSSNMGPMLLSGEDPFKDPVEDNEPDSTGEDMIVVRAVHATNDDDDDDDCPEIPPMNNHVRLLDEEEDPEILEHVEFEL